MHILNYVTPSVKSYVLDFFFHDKIEDDGAL